MNLPKTIAGVGVPLLLILTCTTTLGAKPGPGMATAKAKSVGMSAERLNRFGPEMQKYIDDGLVPGTVTSVALMMLWEEGKFQLRDPVSKFIPEFSNQKVSTTADASGQTGALVDAKREATIRDMLTHTAGLANSYIGNVEYYRQQTKRRPDDTLEAYIARLAALPLNYHPGEAWQYSTATSVVGRLVEVISGQTLAEFMQERIFDPLDMPDTQFYLDDDKNGRLMSQYAPGENNIGLPVQVWDWVGVSSWIVVKPQLHCQKAPFIGVGHIAQLPGLTASKKLLAL